MTPPRTTWAAAAMASSLWLCAPSSALAYSSGARFDEPAADAVTDTWGGGGGRRFTGSPADGFTCVVCHTDANAAEWAVVGLPETGWIPGAEYVVDVAWSAELRQASVALELVHGDGSPAGAVALLDESELMEDERCAGSGVGAHIAWPARDGRTVIASDACGASRLRLRWTAPLSGAGPVWLHATTVQGNGSGDASGDAFDVVAFAMAQQGAPLAERSVTEGGCSVASSPGAGTWLWLVALLAFGLIHRTPRRR